jgi:hypothetical protein
LVVSIAGQFPAAHCAPRHAGNARRRLKHALAAAVAFGCVAGWADTPDHEEQALSPQGVAGEIMDIAVEECRRGHREQAVALFEAIRAQLDPPPAILKLVKDLEATGCSAAPIAQPGVLRVQAGGGWDSNVSQGITARTLALGSGENAIELELAPSFLPRASSFAQAGADYTLALPRYGATVQVALAQRINLQAHDFDLRTASAAVAREWAVPSGSVRGQLEGTEIWLGNHHYQRSAAATLQWLHPLPAGAWLATATATTVDYITQPSQDARTFELGVLREWRIDARRSVHVSITGQADNARGPRPGGDRLGYQAQVGGVILAGRWRLRPQVGYASWRSEDVFAPALIDVKRHNRLQQASLQAETALTPSASLSLEWRGRWARDTVALYRYQSQVVSATLAYRF